MGPQNSGVDGQGGGLEPPFRRGQPGPAGLRKRGPRPRAGKAGDLDDLGRAAGAAGGRVQDMFSYRVLLFWNSISH